MQIEQLESRFLFASDYLLQAGPPEDGVLSVQVAGPTTEILIGLSLAGHSTGGSGVAGTIQVTNGAFPNGKIVLLGPGLK